MTFPFGNDVFRDWAWAGIDGIVRDDESATPAVLPRNFSGFHRLNRLQISKGVVLLFPIPLPLQIWYFLQKN